MKITDATEVQAPAQGRRDRRRGDEDGFGTAMTAVTASVAPPPTPPPVEAPRAEITSIGDAVRAWLEGGVIAPAPAPEGAPAPEAPEAPAHGGAFALAPDLELADAELAVPAERMPTERPPAAPVGALAIPLAVVDAAFDEPTEPAPEAPVDVDVDAAIAAPLATPPPPRDASESPRPDARGLTPVVGPERLDDDAPHGRIRHGVAEISIGEGDDRIDLRIAAHGPHVRVTAVADGAQATALRDGADELAGALSRHGLHLDLSTSGRPHHSHSHAHDPAPDEPAPVGGVTRDDDEPALAGVRIVA